MGYQSSFQSNSVNNNGHKTTINKKQYRDNQKSETFITKITEDKDGNRNVEKLSPENYSNEVKALVERMEETGAVLMYIATPRKESVSDEENNSFLAIDDNSNSYR